jgi:hypothetical protein
MVRHSCVCSPYRKLKRFSEGLEEGREKCCLAVPMERKRKLSWLDEPYRVRLPKRESKRDLKILDIVLDSTKIGYYSSLIFVKALLVFLC